MEERTWKEEHATTESCACDQSEPAAETLSPGAPLICFLLFTLIACAFGLTISDTQLSTASISMIAAAREPSFVSREALLVTRTLSAIFSVSTLWHDMMRPPNKHLLRYWSGSRLPSIEVRLGGGRKYMTFTVNCWTLLTAYFVGAATCSAIDVFEVPVPPLTSTCVGAALWLMHETSFACALLVTAAVTFVLIPGAVKNGARTSCSRFFVAVTLVMHNANAFLMATELLFNALPFRLAHYPVCVLWGVCYVLVAWTMLARVGGVLYPFIDPTLPPNVAIGCHAALLGALGLFFCLANAVAALADVLPLPARVVLVYAAVGCITKVRNPMP